MKRIVTTALIASIVVAAVVFTAGTASARRVTGDESFSVPAVARAEMMSSGVREAEGTVVLCLKPTGEADFTVVERSSGFAVLDAGIAAQLMDWSFEPIVVEGSSVRWCTPVTFRVVIE
jgi:hypothetical protein